eukprot:1219703-Amphidinium_carterae.2
MRRKRAVVQAKRDKTLRDSLRNDQAQLEASRAAEIDSPPDVAFVEETMELPDDMGLKIVLGPTKADAQDYVEPVLSK